MTDSDFPADNESDERDLRADSEAGWVPNPDVVTQRVEGETVLVNLLTNEIYALNATGSRAWDLLVTGLSREALQRELEREFDATPAEISEEIDKLISNLVEKKLLRPAAA